MSAAAEMRDPDPVDEYATRKLNLWERASLEGFFNADWKLTFPTPRQIATHQKWEAYCEEARRKIDAARVAAGLAKEYQPD